MGQINAVQDKYKKEREVWKKEYKKLRSKYDESRILKESYASKIKELEAKEDEIKGRLKSERCKTP